MTVDFNARIVKIWVRWPLVVLACHVFHVAMAADTLDASVQRRLREATFEVVLGKPEKDPLTYEKELPLDLLPYSERTSKYLPIGTAFVIEHDRFITAAHVIAAAVGSQYGPLAVRDAAGQIYVIDKITKYSVAEDYAEFTLQNGPSVHPLATRAILKLNDPVFAVGNALGEGIVIRDGRYTSDTPEERAGRWKWLRFSAAASPGNSGGPLVDRNGAVVGVVLGKSPSENLNIAVAITQVQQGTRAAAILESRFVYRFAPLQATEPAEINDRIPLPEPIGNFFTAYLGASNASLEKARTHYFVSNASRMFPHGDDSVRPLNSLWVAAFPKALEERADRSWSVSEPKPQRTDLDHNGFVEMTNNKGYDYFRLRLPDNVPIADIEGNSKMFMDSLLKTFELKRRVGSESIRVISLGGATQDGKFKDGYGRTWRIQSWQVPFNDTVMVALSLGTPQGYVVMARNCSSYQESAVLQELQSLADFIYLSFEGTLQQWRAFMSQDHLPDVMRTLDLRIDYGKHFQLQSKRIKMKIVESVQDISPTSVLILKMTYFRDGESTVWDVGGIYLADSERKGTWIDVLRRQRPPDSLPRSWADWWHTLEAGTHPYTATAYSLDGGTRIQAVANAREIAARATPIAYTVTVNAEGTQDPREMKRRLDAIESGITILER